MADKYGCVRCGNELVISKSKVDKPTDPKDIPHEIVVFRCPNCRNEFKARSPAHPHPRRN